MSKFVSITILTKAETNLISAKTILKDKVPLRIQIEVVYQAIAGYLSVVVIAKERRILTLMNYLTQHTISTWKSIKSSILTISQRLNLFRLRKLSVNKSPSILYTPTNPCLSAKKKRKVTHVIS
jgi:hypothetical protein